jgi:hypothetical protein
MNDTVRAEMPEGDTARVQPRQAASQPPPRPQPTLLEMQPQPQRIDPEKELAKPLDEMPKFEEVHTFTLARPVTKPNGQVVTEIKCRAPTGLDMFEVGGMPTKTYWTNQGMVIEMDRDRFKAWLGRIADHDALTVYNAPARDVRAIYEWLNGELNPAGN